MITFHNLFLFFIFLVFILGGYVFYNAPLCFDFVIIYISFVSGYLIYRYRIITISHTNKKIITYSGSKLHIMRANQIKKILIYTIAFELLILINNIYKIGFINYLDGNSFVAQIDNYGSYDISSGVMTIVNSVLSYIKWASLFLYIKFSKNEKLKPSIFLLCVPLLILPLLSLSRAEFVYGSLFLVFYLNYIHDRTALTRKSNFKSWKVIFVFIVSFAIALLFANLRQNALNTSSQKDSYNFKSSLLLVAGEFSSVIAYNEIKENIDTLHLQYGKTIIGPLLLKWIPRSIYPEKPINSSALYMQEIRPNEASSGYYLAPTIFGDLFLNFSYFGLIFVIFIGFMAGRLDKTAKSFKSKIENDFLFLYFSYSAYAFLRNNLVESLFSLFATYLFWKILPIMACKRNYKVRRDIVSV